MKWKTLLRVFRAAFYSSVMFSIFALMMTGFWQVAFVPFCLTPPYLYIIVKAKNEGKPRE